MAKEQTQQEQTKQPKPVEEVIIRANFNTTINIPGLGQNQTIAVEQNGPIEKLWAHRLGLALKTKAPMQGNDEFDVVPWANVGNLRVKLVEGK